MLTMNVNYILTLKEKWQTRGQLTVYIRNAPASEMVRQCLSLKAFSLMLDCYISNPIHALLLI